MNEQLEHAIEQYCQMLPNLDCLGNPNDTRRLNKIAFVEINCGEHATCENLIDGLMSNERINNLSMDRLSDFAQARIDDIRVAYNVLNSLRSDLNL